MDNPTYYTDPLSDDQNHQFQQIIDEQMLESDSNDPEDLQRRLDEAGYDLRIEAIDIDEYQVIPGK